MAISSSVQTAWDRNLKVNRALIHHLTAEMLAAQTPGGGYSVAQHLFHISRRGEILGDSTRSGTTLCTT